MVAIIDFIISIFGYPSSSRTKQKSPVPGNNYKQKECISDNKKNIVFRDGAMRTGIVHDSSGKPFLMGGFCIELEDSDEEREMYGVNQTGWNGTIEAKISGDGLITLATQVQLDCNDYIYTGDIASLDYVPYWTIGEGPEGYRRPDHYWY